MFQFLNHCLRQRFVVMFRLGIYLLAALCVVNASVIVNVYGDETKQIATEEKTLEERSCNSQGCYRLCRFLGFHNGVCVGDRCECSNNENINELRSCNYQACDQLCRRLGFPGGVCVGDRCKCDNFKNELDLQKINELESCNYQACEQLCRRLGFPGGACVGDRCKCDNFKNELHSLVIDTKLLNLQEVSEKEMNNENECINSSCEVNCQILGLPGGYCFEGQCICDKNKRDSELRSCDVVACNNICHRLNYIGGMCRGGSCHCY